MNNKQHLFFIGIVGHAMRGIAWAAKQAGHTVTGLDEGAAPGAGTDWLTERGIEWTRIPNPKLLVGVTKIIISGGTPATYPLLVKAQHQGIPVLSFAQYLGELTQNKHVIAISGTHGKTTTTSLVTWLLDSAGRKPDFLIGIRPFNFDSSARLEGSDLFVVEGDEYRGSALDKRSKVQYYHPDVLVLTSVEHDHPDLFPDLASVVRLFKEVVKEIPEHGRLIAWAENATVIEVAEVARCAIITYGLSIGDYTARNIAYQPTGIEFDIENGGVGGRIAVPLYGKHNVMNVLAAIAVCLKEGLTMDQIIAGAATFRGAYRRFNVLTPTDAPVTVVDDYAHHPTEVRVTLEGARLHYAGRRIVAVFRPHTFSRTSALLKEYRAAFGAADLVYITDIEAAREAGKDQTVSGLDIVAKLPMPALYTPERDDLIERLKRDVRPGDVILCMTVSGHQKLAEELAETMGPIAIANHKSGHKGKSRPDAA